MLSSQSKKTPRSRTTADRHMASGPILLTEESLLRSYESYHKIWIIINYNDLSSIGQVGGEPVDGGVVDIETLLEHV